MNDKNNSRIIKTLSLVDGTKVLIRPITPDDAQIEWDFVHELSAQSRYYRFLGGIKDLTPNMVHYFTHIDETKDYALIATISDEKQKEKEIAVGRYFTGTNPGECEFAIVVADQFHGQGIGSTIMQLLIEDARYKGHKYMTGQVAGTNHKMLALAKKLGFQANRDDEDKTLFNINLNL